MIKMFNSHKWELNVLLYCKHCLTVLNPFQIIFISVQMWIQVWSLVVLCWGGGLKDAPNWTI